MMFTSFDVTISLDKHKHVFLTWLLKLIQYSVSVPVPNTGGVERSIYGSICSQFEC